MTSQDLSAADPRTPVERLAQALGRAIAAARAEGVALREIERLLYDALAAQGGGGLGVRIHGLDATQIAALRDFYHAVTGSSPLGLDSTEIHGRNRLR